MKKDMSYYRKGLFRKQIEKDYINKYRQILNIDDLGDNLIYIYLYSEILKNDVYTQDLNKANTTNCWESFLLQDESLLLSLISKTDTRKIRDDLNDYAHFFHVSEIKRKTIVIFQLNVVIDLVVLVNFWYTKLQSFSDFKHHVEDCIIKILIPLVRSIFYFENLESELKNEIVYLKDIINKLQAQNPLWNLNLVDNVKFTQKEYSIEELYDFFKYNILSILDQIDSLTVKADKIFSESLNNKDHDPHIGLLICFLQILQESKKYLNYIPIRYVLNEYSNNLGIDPRVLKPFSSIVNLELNDKFDSVLIPSGTDFYSNSGEKKKLAKFVSVGDLVVNKSSIKNIIIGRSDGRLRKESLLGISDSILIKKIGAEKIDSKLPFSSFDVIPFSRVGFLLESPLLDLPSGERIISLEFCLDKDSYEQFAISLYKNNRELEHVNIVPYISKILSIYISTKEKWFFLDFKHISASTDPLSLTIKFYLKIPIWFPSIKPLENINEHSFVSNPSIKFLLNTNNDYSDFAGYAFWRIKKISINVDVKSSKEFSTFNDFGSFAPNVVIVPYGPSARINSKFYVNCKRILQKQPKKLSINVKWDNLPSETTSWEDYYRGYSVPIKNDSFKVEARISLAKKWYETSLNNELYSLFDQEKDNFSGNMVVSNTKKFNFDIDKIVSHHNLDLARPSIDHNDGTFRFELKQPSIAFGNQDYSESIKRNILQSFQNKAFDEIVQLNLPYSPIVEDLTIDYQLFFAKSYDCLDTHESQIDIYTINNLGYKKLKYLDQQHAVPIMYEGIYQVFIEDYNLIKIFIGFDLVFTTLYSIHFEISRSSGISVASQESLQMFYLSDNEWIKLEKKYVLSDTTQNFSQSGIIKFFIPKEINKNNTIMSEDYFWIQIISLEDINLQMPTILGIYNNAVEIQEKKNEDNDKYENIDSLNFSDLYFLEKKYVKAINQPFKLIELNKQETLDQYIRRSQSIIKHKERPVTVIHIEEAIIEKFPNVHFVKCLQYTSISRNLVNAPGYVSIIIGSKDFAVPLQDSIINEITGFLKNIMSPQIDLEVTFPYIEKIKLFLNFQLDESKVYGDYLSQLKKAINDLFLKQNSNGFEYSSILQEDFYISDIYSEILKFKFVKNIRDLFVIKTISTPEKDVVIKLDKFDDSIIPTFPWSIIVGFVEISIYTNSMDFVNNFSKKSSSCISDAAVGVNFLVGPWKSGKAKTINTRGESLLHNETFTLINK